MPTSQPSQVPAPCTPRQAPCGQAVFTARPVHCLKSPRNPVGKSCAPPFADVETEAERALLARQGPCRVWAAGLAGSKACLQRNADSLLSPHRSQLPSLPVTLGGLRGLWCNPTSAPAARVSLCPSRCTRTHLPASPLLLVTRAHTQPNTHTSPLSPSVDQTPLLPSRARRQSQHRPGGPQGLLRPGLLPGEQRTSGRPQVRLHILRVLPAALAAAHLPQELLAAQEDAACLGDKTWV